MEESRATATTSAAMAIPIPAIPKHISQEDPAIMSFSPSRMSEHTLQEFVSYASKMWHTIEKTDRDQTRLFDAFGRNSRR